MSIKHYIQTALYHQYDGAQRENFAVNVLDILLTPIDYF